MSATRRKWSRFLSRETNQRLALAVLWSSIGLAICLLCFLGFRFHSRTYARLENDAISYAHLIAAHDRFDLTLAELLIAGVMDRLSWNDFNGTMTPERRLEVTGFLKQNRDRLPGIASFTIIGLDGIRRIGLVGKDFTNLSHREYFLALRDGKNSYISHVEEGL